MRSTYLIRLFVFCVLLLLIRALKTGHFGFFLMLWNLFLAWLPLLIIKQYEHVRKKIPRYSLVVLTLLILPNAPYILTDLFHLGKSLSAPAWFDLILILSFSILGLSFFILTTECVLGIFAEQVKSRFHLSLIKFLIILSNGYGIYLGRYLRFNSWDIISHPDNLVLQIFHSVFDGNCYKETLGITFTFTIFLYLVYEIYESFKRKEARTNELF